MVWCKVIHFIHVLCTPTKMALPCSWTEFVDTPNIQQVFLSASLLWFVWACLACFPASATYILSNIFCWTFRGTQNVNLTQCFDNVILTCDSVIVGQNKQINKQSPLTVLEVKLYYLLLDKTMKVWDLCLWWLIYNSSWTLQGPGKVTIIGLDLLFTTLYFS